MKKIYIVGGANNYANWLEQIGYNIVDTKEEADVIMFTGGEDVTPSIYKHKYLPGTYCNPSRDEKEIEFFNWALKFGLPMIGVCRGSQFIGAMSGAKLVQDMNHPYRHKVTTFDGKQLVANSTHHQAVFIPDSMVEGQDYQLLAWAENISPYHTIADDSIKFPKNYKETECTWWIKTKCFGIQSHPEMTLNSEWNTWLQEQVIQFIGV